MAHRFVLSLSFLVLLYFSSCVTAKHSHSNSPSLDDLAERLSKLEQQQQSGIHLLEGKDDKFHRFVSRPDIGAPKWNVKIHDPDAVSPGYWFVAPYAKLEQISFK